MCSDSSAPWGIACLRLVCDSRRRVSGPRQVASVCNSSYSTTFGGHSSAVDAGARNPPPRVERTPARADAAEVFKVPIARVRCHPLAGPAVTLGVSLSSAWRGTARDGGGGGRCGNAIARGWWWWLSTAPATRGPLHEPTGRGAGRGPSGEKESATIGGCGGPDAVPRRPADVRSHRDHRPPCRRPPVHVVLPINNRIVSRASHARCVEAAWERCGDAAGWTVASGWCGRP